MPTILYVRYISHSTTSRKVQIFDSFYRKAITKRFKLIT